MKKWEKVILALDSASRTERARYIFQLLEKERIESIDTYREHRLKAEIKIGVNQILKLKTKSATI